MAAYVIPPAGVTPVSFWVPSTYEEPVAPPALLADDLDGDGEIQSMGTFVHPVDAAVREAFRLSRGTGAAVVDAGQAFKAIRKNTTDAPRRLEDEANRILQRFVDRGDIAVLSVKIDTSLAPDLGAVYVQYTNLRTMQLQTIGRTPA